MSLSKEPLFSKLKTRFVCGYRDISGEPYAGDSGAHKVKSVAVDTTNGAGPHNIQLFFMTPEGVVLHCLPGYWQANDLKLEVELAEKIADLWQNNAMTADQKQEAYKRLQLDHVRVHPVEMVARSKMQGFDMMYEAKYRLNTSDTIKDRSLIEASAEHPPAEAFRTTDELLHLRMAERPFMVYNEFDTAEFSDYGTQFYDKHENNTDEFGKPLQEDFKVRGLKAGLREAACSSGTSCASGGSSCSTPPPAQKKVSRQAMRNARLNNTPKTYVRNYGSLRRETP